jgi:DNA polymerase
MSRAADPAAWRDAVRRGGAALEAARAAAAGCQACGLWRRGTQTVFGEGPRHASLLLVGEQPGDQEDRSGRPFVGPAGRVLDRALREAGLVRERVYVTNVVKHFKWRPRGKFRIHQKPDAGEVQACRPWLEAEVAAVAPRGVLLLGATAAIALLGSRFRVTRSRGQRIESPLAPHVMATIHPSVVLRQRDARLRQQEFEHLVEDLRRMAELLGTGEGTVVEPPAERAAARRGARARVSPDGRRALPQPRAGRRGRRPRAS